MRRQDGDFGEDALVGWAGHDLVRVAFGATVWSNDRDGWSKILDEVPPSPSDGEEVEIVCDMSEYVERCMMLEEEVHLYPDATNVLKHVAELHILWV